MKHLQFTCCVSDETTALPHFWEHTIGSSHGLLCDKMGTMMDEKDE